MGNNKENKDNDTVEIKSYVKVETEPKKNKQSEKKQHDNKQHDNKQHNNKHQESKHQEKKAQEVKQSEKKQQEKKHQEIKHQEKKKQEVKQLEKKQEEKKQQDNKQSDKKENTIKAAEVKTAVKPSKEITKTDNTAIINIAKIVLPIVACAIVVATLLSYVGTHRGKSDSTDGSDSSSSTVLRLSDEPLQENAYPEVNELMVKFYNALASGDMDTVRALRDYNDDTEIIQFEKRSEFIDAYDNIVCYTKPGLDESSYFVYVSFDAHVKDAETEAPGLNAYFVYTNDDGNLIIDGNIEDDVDAAFKLVTNQDDVVDLYNRVDVNYKEAIASDEQLASVLNEIPMQIKTAVGEELAQIYAQNSEEQTTEAATEEDNNLVDNADSSDLTENQTVNQTVKTTDTVNVRSSDSETADKIGKAAVGTELKRIEIRVNGWSKVEFEGKEAYIKSDYLEVVATDDLSGDTDNTVAAQTTTETVLGTVMALTNVNVRQSASQTSTKLGTAVALTKYDLIGVEGEWYKIKYNGQTGYVKAEYLKKQ